MKDKKNQVYILMLIGMVNNPRKYDHVLNADSAFDAAEYLLNNHWDDVNAYTKVKIETILLKSGKYVLE